MLFAKWTKEQVYNLPHEQGLGFNIGHGKHWILYGQTLLQTSQTDLEKELGIKHPLHQGKLHLRPNLIKKVVSILHHLSIKRAIQILRINNFEPSCLGRRPSDGNNITPSEVLQWPNHQMMEWLHSVDLAEYTGSGVHGGLMVLEHQFNVETMAQLLNIPSNKTLLRWHLATHFNLLIGQESHQQKCEAMEPPDYVLLTATVVPRVKNVIRSGGPFLT
uniref:Uncharacterized protein n=1 Tax=Podarcis muralis TaxID=64176 RepID=A0A670I0G7_PODMU